VSEPLAEPLPWQEAIYEGRRLTPIRLVMGGPRLGRRIIVTAMLAEAIRTGERVSVCASSEAEADALMAEARRLLEAEG
jgi:hypothetical protein